MTGAAAKQPAAGDTSRKLSAADCARLVLEAQPMIAGNYTIGAVPWATEHAPELLDELHASEAALDALAGRSPEAAAFVAALDHLTAAWAAISQRFESWQERGA